MATTLSTCHRSKTPRSQDEHNQKGASAPQPALQTAWHSLSHRTQVTVPYKAFSNQKHGSPPSLLAAGKPESSLERYPEGHPLPPRAGQGVRGSRAPTQLYSFPVCGQGYSTTSHPMLLTCLLLGGCVSVSLSLLFVCQGRVGLDGKGPGLGRPGLGKGQAY